MARCVVVGAYGRQRLSHTYRAPLARLYAAAVATAAAPRVAGTEETPRARAAELDHDRAQITEMHAQGLQPHHIAAELGLPGAQHVDTAIDALGLRAKRPSKGTRRHKAQPRQAPSLSPSDRARVYRERKRQRKRERGEL